MKRPKRRAVALLVLAFTPVAALSLPPVRVLALQTVGRVLVAEDQIDKADIAVVPTWAGAAGALEVAYVHQRGAIDRVAIMAGPTDPAERELIRRGVPFDNDVDRLAELLASLGVTKIERIPHIADGTEAQGEILATWSDEHQFRSIIVISAPDHSRRLRRVLRRSMSGRTTQVYVRFTRIADFAPEAWWSDRAGVRIAIVELEKLLLDILRHPLS